MPASLAEGGGGGRGGRQGLPGPTAEQTPRADHVGPQRPLVEIPVAKWTRGAQPVRWGRSGKHRASCTRPREKQGDDSTSGTKAHCWPSAHTSTTRPVGTAQGTVFKFLGLAAWVQVLTPPYPCCVTWRLGGQVNLSLSLRLLRCKRRIRLGGQYCPNGCELNKLLFVKPLKQCVHRKCCFGVG